MLYGRSTQTLPDHGRDNDAQQNGEKDHDGSCRSSGLAVVLLVRMVENAAGRGVLRRNDTSGGTEWLVCRLLCKSSNGRKFVVDRAKRTLYIPHNAMPVTVTTVVSSGKEKDRRTGGRFACFQNCLLGERWGVCSHDGMAMARRWNRRRGHDVYLLKFFQSYMLLSSDEKILQILLTSVSVA